MFQAGVSIRNDWVMLNDFVMHGQSFPFYEILTLMHAYFGIVSHDFCITLGYDPSALVKLKSRPDDFTVICQVPSHQDAYVTLQLRQPIVGLHSQGS